MKLLLAAVLLLVVAVPAGAQELTDDDRAWIQDLVADAVRSIKNDVRPDLSAADREYIRTTIDAELQPIVDRLDAQQIQLQAQHANLTTVEARLQEMQAQMDALQFRVSEAQNGTVQAINASQQGVQASLERASKDIQKATIKELTTRTQGLATEEGLQDVQRSAARSAELGIAGNVVLWIIAAAAYYALRGRRRREEDAGAPDDQELTVPNPLTDLDVFEVDRGEGTGTRPQREEPT